MLPRNRQIDPINLLRQFKTEKKPIKLKDQYLYFDNIRLALKTETAWLSKKSNKQYDLGTLWLRLEHDEKNTQFKQYYKEATELGLQPVSNVDRDEISNYFTGVINYTEDIDNELRNSLNQKKQSKKNKDNFESFENIDKKIKKDENNSASKPPEQIVVEKEKEEEKEQIKIMEYLLKHEKPIESKNKALRIYNKSFKFAIDYIMRQQKMSQEIRPKNEKISLLEKYIRRDPNGFSEQQKPLIVVPQIKYPGNINLLNVLKFLMEGEYEEFPANKLITVQKFDIKYKISHYEMNFQIIEDPKDQWKNVVAVFLSGQKNEIKNWPDSDQPAILFSKVLGFYMKYHDMPIPEDVSKLNVNVLNVNRNKRYQDMLLQKAFWDKLTKFMIEKRNIN